MRIGVLIISAFNIVFFIGCTNSKMDIQPDICASKRLPGEYFPAYPHSFWTYRNEQNQVVNFTISGEYQSCLGKCRTTFNNLNVCVDGQSFVSGAYHGLGVSSIEFSSIYSLIRDSSFICPVAFSRMWVDFNFLFLDDIKTRRTTVVLDTTIELITQQVYSNVLVVKESIVNSPSGYYCDYFAKNIGLIKRDSIYLQDTVQILYLENFHIGH